MMKLILGTTLLCFVVGDLDNKIFWTPDCTGTMKHENKMKTDGTCYNQSHHQHDHYVTAKCNAKEAVIFTWKDEKCTVEDHNHTFAIGSCNKLPHHQPGSIMATCPQTADKEIKVLSFTGQGAGIDDVDNQHMCFKKDLLPGIKIRGTKANRITSSALSGYDVILMPGGSSFYVSQSDVDVSAIKAFVKSGKGYYGTCAGAYGGCTSIRADENGVINPYTNETVEAIGTDANGKKIYPNQAGMGVSRTTCDKYMHVGTSDNLFTQQGLTVFKDKDVKIDHHNGPAMTAQGSTVAATFNDGQRKGSASFVLDTYGSGRSILVSPHPEHTQLQNCDIVTRCAAYAGGAIAADELFV